MQPFLPSKLISEPDWGEMAQKILVLGQLARLFDLQVSLEADQTKGLQPASNGAPRDSTSPDMAELIRVIRGTEACESLDTEAIHLHQVC